MKRALLISTISGFVPQFEMNSVHILQEHGYEVHYATNYNYVFYGKDNSRLDGTGIVRHQIDFARSPFSKHTYIAYKQLNKLLSNISFDVIHCHTAIGGVLARLLGKKYGVPKIIYTAHGFHFYKGAPIVNWLFYYPVEKYMARYTDALITINSEDFIRAQKFKLQKGGHVYQISGVGIDTRKFRDISVDYEKKRKELGINDNDFVMVSVGELNVNKNHEVVIKGLSKIKHEQIKYFICGEGEYHDDLQALIEKLGLVENVFLLGYRTDIVNIEKIADLFVFPSKREGLPVALMEAMASGLPVLASKIRGNIDLLESQKNGWLISSDNEKQWGEYIFRLSNQRTSLKKMGRSNIEKIKKYDVVEVKKQIESIYREQGVIK